jgi:hypothetical protein
MGATAVFDMAAETPPAMKSLANETASIGISTIFRSIISEFIFIKKKNYFSSTCVTVTKSLYNSSKSNNYCWFGYNYSIHTHGLIKSKN